MIRKSIPDHSPLLAPNLICHGCGVVMEPQVITGFGGVVQHLRYDHKNEETGCSYRLETNGMVVAEMKPLREDGTEVKL